MVQSEAFSMIYKCLSVIDCGDPPSVNDAVQLSGTGTHYGSVARFGCEEGFLWKSGDITSVCGVDSQWIGPSLVCEGKLVSSLHLS